MSKQNVKPESVGATVEQRLLELYGQPVRAVLLWLPPGATEMESYSNCEPAATLMALHRAALRCEVWEDGLPQPRAAR